MRGAGSWLGVYEDRGLVFDGSRPHRGDGPAGRNPTAARVARPAPAGETGEDWSDHAPAVPADGAAGPRWTARCDDSGTAGRATGISLGGPVLVAGSTSAAAVAAGTYTGTARAYVQGLGPSLGALDSLASVVLAKLECTNRVQVAAHIHDAGLV